MRLLYAPLSCGLLLFILVTDTAFAQENLQRARLLISEGAYAEAVELLEPSGFTNPDAANLLGQAYQAMLRHDRAVTAFERADTTNLRILSNLGESLERIGQPDAAEARYRSAYRKDSTNQAVAASLARMLGDREQWGDVADIYKRLLEEDPDNSYLHAQLGTAYAQLGIADSAIVHYERAHQLDNRNVRVVLALTKVYYDNDYLLSAKRVVDRALDERPRDPALWKRRGEVALAEEEYLDATDAFRAVLTYGDSTSAVDLRNFGIAQYLNGDFMGALEAHQKAYAADSLDALTAFYLGASHQQLQHFDEALYYLQKASILSGRESIADIESRIANTYDQMNRSADAIRSYRLALNLDPRRNDLLFHLAALYDEYYADPSTALKQYEAFLDTVREDQMPQLQNYARQRVAEIKEQQFFGKSGAPKPDTSEIVITPPDSAKTEQ